MLPAYTINNAKEAFMEKIIGSIEIGKKVNMVILAQDITKIKPEDISKIGIVNTIFSGMIHPIFSTKRTKQHIEVYGKDGYTLLNGKVVNNHHKGVELCQENT